MPPLKSLDLFNTQRLFCHLAVAHSNALRLNITINLKKKKDIFSDLESF